MRPAGGLRIEIVPARDLAQRTAAHIAGLIREAVRQRGRCVAGFSGGSTPEPMLRDLAGRDLPWADIHIVQVDERVAPEGHPERNLTLLRSALGEIAPIHAMPVEAEDLDRGARDYERLLARLCGGGQAVIDVVHLGIGEDGHTASLFPEDPALEIADADVAAVSPHQGWRRMTLTLPMINRSRAIVWQVAGEGKTDALRDLAAGADIPASRVRRQDAVLFADAPAGRGVSP